jgi:phage gp29-like protein
VTELQAPQRYRVASALSGLSSPVPPYPGDLGRSYFAGHVPESEQYRPYWGRSLDLTKIESAIVSANAGLMARMTDLSRETIMLDGDVSAFLQKRLNRVAALDWDCIPATGTGLDEGRAKERAAEVRENLQMIPNFRDRIMDLAWGNFDGRAASELEWVRRGVKWNVRDLHWIHPRRLSFGPCRDLRVVDPQRQTGNFRDVGFPLEYVPYKFVTFRPRLFGDYQEREGLAPRTLYWSFFKRLGTREQLELMEIFGKPWRILLPKFGQNGVMTPGLQNVDAYDKAFQALQMLGFHNTARMPPGVEVQIVQPQEGAGAVHNDVVKACRDVLSKLFLGGVATTDAISTGLGSTIGDIHLTEEDLIIAGDARRIAECLEDQLTDAIVIANYGPSEVVYAPKFVIRTDPPTDRAAEGTRIKAAIDVGLRVAEEEARERLGFRAVRPDEAYIGRIQREVPPGQIPPPPAPETVWPVGNSPPPGEIPDLPDVALNLPDARGEPISGPDAAGTPPARGAPGLPPPEPESALPGAPGNLPAAASTGDDDLIEPDEIAELAAQMTELGCETCAHGKKNRCPLCGVERSRRVETGPDGSHVWPVAWKPIGAKAARPAAVEPEQIPGVAGGRIDPKAAQPSPAGDDFEPAGDEPLDDGLDDDEEDDDDEPQVLISRGELLELLGEEPDEGECRSLLGKVGSAVLLAAQPATVYGSPDDLVQRGTPIFAEQSLVLGEDIARRVDGKTDPKAILKQINAAGKAWDRSRFAEPVEQEVLQGMQLGALDADFEMRANEKVAPETFSQLHAELVLLKKGDPGFDTDPAFSKRPQVEATKSFIEKEPVTRDVFDRMTASAKRRSFTVANAATKEIVRTVKRELVRQVAAGADLRNFKTAALDRMQAAGWTPKNPSHVETVFRTNVMTGYNSGRYRQMTQPAVVAARPYWQILGVGDGPPRERKNHAAVNNAVLAASDPFWLKAYPPFGYNCRHRVRSLSKRQGEAIGITSGSTITDLPDPGFDSGLSSLISPNEVPAPVPTPTQVPDDVTPVPPRAAPTFDLPDNPLDSLEGLGSLRGADDLPESTQRAIATSLRDAGLGRLKVPDVALQLHADDASWLAANPTYPKAAGLYDPAKQIVSVRPRTGNKLGQKIDGVWNIADAAKTSDEYVSLTAVHEWGHHAHLTGGRKVDTIVQNAYKAAVPKPPTPGFPIFDPQGAPSMYAVSNPLEFWAESFAAHHKDPAWLEKTKPIAFRMVQDVLAVLQQ